MNEYYRFKIHKNPNIELIFTSDGNELNVKDGVSMEEIIETVRYIKEYCGYEDIYIIGLKEDKYGLLRSLI